MYKWYEGIINRYVVAVLAAAEAAAAVPGARLQQLPRGMYIMKPMV
jgi:hypothetical protein